MGDQIAVMWEADGGADEISMIDMERFSPDDSDEEILDAVREWVDEDLRLRVTANIDEDDVVARVRAALAEQPAEEEDAEAEGARVVSTAEVIAGLRKMADDLEGKVRPRLVVQRGGSATARGDSMRRYIVRRGEGFHAMAECEYLHDALEIARAVRGKVVGLTTEAKVLYDRSPVDASEQAYDIATRLDFDAFAGVRDAYEHALEFMFPNEYRDTYPETLMYEVIRAYKAYRRELRA